MAAEVPASEVLCEAAEYLSKLGSNLRNRSENLKDKKIRKDKLNNVLALQKAASKVLLICELSKKSLENVESGVRKILQQIDKSQKSSPNGGKITESDKATSSGSTEPKYFYFEYKARKIKIKKKISLKHYTSVKVFAKRIPQSMIEKYPVYYDCKLYRTRKKEERFLNSKNKPEIAVSDLKDNNKEDSNECVKKLSEPIIPILYSPKSVRKIIEHEEIDTSVVSIADTSNSKKFTEDEKPDDSVICVEDDHAADDHKTSMKTSVARRISLDSKTKKDAKLKSEKDLKDNKHKSSQVSPKNPKEGGKYDNSKKKFKKVRILNDSSDEDVVEKSREISEVEEIKDLEQKNEGNKEVDENCSESAPKMRKHSHSVDQTQNDEKQDTNSEKKPIIKCVSLSKLLKPDVLQNNGLDPKNKLAKENSQTSKSKDNDLITKKKSDRLIRKEIEEKEYWAQKRKEVSSFKPKKFVINIMRLPELSVYYLNKLSLNKITCNGKTLCEIENMGDLNIKSSQDKEKTSHSTDNTFKMNKEKTSETTARKRSETVDFKKALLNDSESDNDLITEANKVTSSLLNNSDSECDCLETEKNELVKKSQFNDSNGSKDSKTKSKKKKSESDDKSRDSNVINNSDSDDSKDSKTKKSKKEYQVRDKDTDAKNSLLYDSDYPKDSDTKKSKKESQVSDNDKNTDAIKNSLLNDSDDSKDSDTKKSKKESQVSDKDKDTDAIKNSLLNDSDDSKDSQTRKSKKEAQLVTSWDKVRNDLLHDSDSASVDKANSANNSDEELHYETDKSENSLEKFDYEKDKSEQAKSENTLDKLNCETDKSEQSKSEKLHYASDESEQLNNEKTPEKLNYSTDKSEQSKSEKSPEKLYYESDKNELAKSEKSPEEHNETDKSQQAKSEKSPDKHHCDTDKSQQAKSEKSPDKHHCDIDKSEQSKSEKSPEKLHYASDENEQPNNAKTPEKPQNSSSDEKTNTPLSQRRISRSLSPLSKKKRLRESVHAKKMLMTYSSSSDTEDEKLKDVFKEIKDCLLHGSDEETASKRKSSSSAEDNILTKVKKKILEVSDDEKKPKHKRKKHRKRVANDNSDQSDSSSNKMVRSKSKPGNCSSQNSDAQDTNDKDIDGLTNLESLNKTRSHRRNSDATDQTDSTSVATRRSGKKTGLICEEMLKAESSSDAASDDDNDNIEEELPTVTIPNFNGDSEHLVKEDLLGDSDDSSESQNEDANKDDSESEEKAQNARRRKANAISSDSEVGSSRKKDVVKVSDFEDSEEDTSETGKRTKRKKKDIDSDASGDSSNEGGKKKRRRIKSINDSDVSGSESETEGRNKHGRKNIRKVMGKNQLEEATKKAAREEKERMARIAERQKLYNNLEFDESGKPDEVVLEKVVLDFDPETKEPLIEVDRGLVKKLKPHQANGIKFMWDACFESVKRIKKGPGSGCILAHCMGLGKTLQVVSLTHTLLTHADLTRVNRVLVVCPLSTVLNWVNEFKMWLQHAVTDYDVDVYELSRFKQNSERAFQLSQWFTHGGVCVLGYEMFRNLSADNNKKFKKKMLKNFQESLVDPGPDLVVCDEGHLLKNEKTSLSQSMNRVRTLRRIVLTGTPLQNNLKEYYCMVTFVKPNLLGKYNEYLNRFVNPITNGQYTDSTEHDIKIMKRRSHVLHKMLDGAVQRRDYGVLAPFLPPKHEYVLFITLSEVQVKLYQHYLDNFSRQPLPGKSSGFLFPDFQSLQRIWTHPLVLKYNSERYEILQQKKRDKEEEDSEGSLVDFIDDDSVTEGSSTEEPTDDSSDMSDDSRKKSKKKKKSSKKSKNKDKEPKGDGPARGRRGTRANPIEHEVDDNDDDIIEVKNENPTEWWIKLVTEDELDDMRNSHKLILLFDILRQCEAIGDKLLVFSQSLYSLDLIEHFLGKVDEATQEGRIDEKLGGHVGSWSPGVDYFRLDGSTSCENRSIWCKNFNREDNPRARLFLISTRAGGLGINLVAANRVVIFDVSWNPSHDVQSIFRVYRFGQKKPCYVYRFLAMGTMEEKIYERQVTKQAISKRVIDEQQIDRHYAENDLAELYKFEPKPPSPRPIPPLPKDRLFAEMLREHDAQIYKYHEHDSLLENKEEETLSEEERKAAWEDFENEKNRPPPAPYAAPWPMHNGMVPNILAQQQQYAAAYAALGATLRKEVPNISDDQIKAMLPLIYNANPQMFGGYDYGLMQKMNDLYKYTNMSGMMNAGMMMNPGVMNAASGTGAGGMSGMGGASGLQYEPPWQRQQQQQQQMRLQQLMQQQNQMGAKLYAGGLGSRDPVAMALQQQRAREIMLGGASSRPRGRPPLQPRAPPPSADIVNLDSD